MWESTGRWHIVQNLKQIVQRRFSSSSQLLGKLWEPCVPMVTLLIQACLQMGQELAAQSGYWLGYGPETVGWFLAGARDISMDRAFMLTVLAQLTHWIIRNKKSCVHGSLVLHTLEHSRTDQIICIISQPSIHGECKLANSAFHLIGSVVFQCMEYQWTMKVWQKTFYFSF
jgi:hypothetical protein